MTWEQRLKRVFQIDIEVCDHCGGAVKVIASIEDPVVIKKILDHLARRAEAATPAFRPFARAPPQKELPGLLGPGCRYCAPSYARTRGRPDTPAECRLRLGVQTLDISV